MLDIYLNLFQCLLDVPHFVSLIYKQPLEGKKNYLKLLWDFSLVELLRWDGLHIFAQKIGC
jgi:hypothetical protein